MRVTLVIGSVMQKKHGKRGGATSAMKGSVVLN